MKPHRKSEAMYFFIIFICFFFISDNAINNLTQTHAMEIANPDCAEFAAKYQKQLQRCICLLSAVNYFIKSSILEIWQGA